MNTKIVKLCAGEEARKRGIHPGFETQGRRHQKSKTGVSVAPQKGFMSSKFFLKNYWKLDHLSLISYATVNFLKILIFNNSTRGCL